MGKLAKNPNYLRDKRERKRLKRRGILQHRMEVYGEKSAVAIEQGIKLFAYLKAKAKAEKKRKEKMTFKELKA